MATQLLNTPSTHKWSLVSTLDSVWNTLRDTLIDVGSGPAAGLAQTAVLSHLSRMNHGHLRILTSEREYVFPVPDKNRPRNEHDNLRAEFKVLSGSFWIRLALMSDLGFAEAFMYGDVQCEDLVSVFQIFIKNRKSLADMSTSLSWLASLPQTLTQYRFLNTISNSRSNISAHYDISNQMFAGFLSEDMTYSCGIFSDLDADLHHHNKIVRHPRSSSWDRDRALSSSEADVKKEFQHETRWSNAIVAAVQKESLRSSTARFTIATTTSTTNTTNSGINTPEEGAIIINHNDNDAVEPTLAEDAGDPESDSTDSEQTCATSTSTPVSSLLNKKKDDLYDAQMRKIHHIIRKADIRPGHRVLEIGSGWGALAIEAVRLTGCEVDTLTLSVAQKVLAEERIAAAGPEFAQKIRVHLMDYRAMPEEWQGTFDRFVSVEMIEAVGREFLEGYWTIVDWALKKENAMGVVQVITIPEARFENYIREVDFIRKWIFPGGFLPTVNFLVETLTKGSSGSLIVESISNIGPHYARTLREWRRRFEAKFDEVIVPALQSEYPDVMGPQTGLKGLREIEVFKRKWIYYYCYCEVGFTTRTLGDHIMTFTREGNSSFGCDVYE